MARYYSTIPSVGLGRETWEQKRAARYNAGMSFATKLNLFAALFCGSMAVLNACAICLTGELWLLPGAVLSCCLGAVNAWFVWDAWQWARWQRASLRVRIRAAVAGAVLELLAESTKELAKNAPPVKPRDLSPAELARALGGDGASEGRARFNAEGQWRN